MRRTKLRLITAVVLAVLAFSACKIGPQTDPPPTPLPGAKPGGAITVGIARPSAIDPALASDPAGQLIASLICETMIKLDPVTGEEKIGLARTFNPTEDGQAAIFAMKRHLKHNDGSELLSDDVAFAFARLANLNTASPFAELMSSVRGYEILRGEDPRTIVEFSTQLRGARIIDPFGFEIRLTNNSSDFVRTLSHPSTAPVDRDRYLAGPTQFESKPVCHGPYQLEKPWAPTDNTIVLIRFDGYHGQSVTHTHGGKGYADRIEFKVFESEEEQYQAFLRGEIDIASIPSPRYAEAKALGDPFKEGKAASIEMIGFPSSVPPFEDPRARVALSQVLDRQKIAETVYGVRREPARGFLPGVLGPFAQEKGCGDRAPVTPDLPAAQATLRGQKPPVLTVDAAALLASPAPGGARQRRDPPASFDGVSVPFYYNDEHGNGALVAEIAAQWTAAFGITFTPSPLNWEVFLQRANSGVGFDGPFRVSWAPPVMSADAYIGELISSSGDGPNLGRYTEAELSRVLNEEVGKVTDEGDRAIEYRKLEARVCEQMPLIPVVIEKSRYLVNTNKIASARSHYIELDGKPALLELYVKQ